MLNNRCYSRDSERNTSFLHFVLVKRKMGVRKINKEKHGKILWNSFPTSVTISNVLKEQDVMMPPRGAPDVLN